MINYAAAVAAKTSISHQQVIATIELLEQGATIPFIARYRKDITGALDEVQIQSIQEEAKFQQEFEERKAFIIKTITAQDKFTEEIEEKLNNATSLNTLEDIYLPFKPKRKTKAQAAREKGLEPFALMILEQNQLDLEQEAKAFINEHVINEAAALQGANDIIAEIINEDADIRAQLRKLFEQHATLQSSVLTDKEEEGKKYKDYFQFEELIKTVPSHRVLAILRGFMEGFLKMNISPDEENALQLIEKAWVKNNTSSGDFVKKSSKDAYRRLLLPSLESEFRLALKNAADEEAINVFAENLRQLLLSSPLGSKRILAIDPGYRTGCKVVIIDEKGDLAENSLIYIHEKNYKLDEAKNILLRLVQQYKIEAFAIGDGTAGRETEQFVKSLECNIPIFLVNEDGASIYSASAIARSEFPDYDVTVRGAVSIGRRLMDPLAELVKIDPKSIGVGQYQHDVNQVRLKEKLDQTVESCVNAVGVNLNTAGKELLSYVSGIGPTVAENIIKYRKENGKFNNRKELLKVGRLGPKVYELCAGFLRIKDGNNPLDYSGVHPESYTIVQSIAKDMNVSMEQLIGNETLVKDIPIKKYVSDTIGIHTIQDIIKELQKPGLDPRSDIQSFEFANVFSIEEVHEGMILPGIVTNLTRFGAFVDIGVKQDGLVHISEIANHYISDPSEVLKLNDQVKVKVVEVDKVRKRIALSIKQTMEEGSKQNRKGKTEKKQTQPENIMDALSMLKKKFGK